MFTGTDTVEQDGRLPSLEKIRLGLARPGNFRRGLTTYWQ